MAKTKSASRQVDEYIDTAQDFAKPICKKLRQIIFKAEPGIIEDWKWGPNYSKNGMVCGFNHFTSHVSFSFFQGALLKDPQKILNEGSDNLHNRGIKFKDVKEVDEKTLTAYIKEAVANNVKGIKVNIKEKKEIKIPVDFLNELKLKKLHEKFNALSYTYRKEYIQWIESAKKEETRIVRIKKGIEKISKGLKINDKV
jgi:hypothetical protein